MFNYNKNINQAYNNFGEPNINQKKEYKINNILNLGNKPQNLRTDTTNIFNQSHTRNIIKQNNTENNNNYYNHNKSIYNSEKKNKRIKLYKLFQILWRK